MIEPKEHKEIFLERNNEMFADHIEVNAINDCELLDSYQGVVLSVLFLS